ncbi:SDR family NAD(P)-dependent oxidoreductase [Mycobacterium sp. AT1]|uniref:SDR family NAD(P)-dependent oxidoreductase n=1 Tax=Mycobacterium sp. AT1 TaxID=1961706 RepID=UPI0009ADC05F|nr:SDR family oxidoreductase [Mycobacterium sp. AT1]OPX10661.1 2,3-dihydroxy-2,3-dihydro-p-cumate dehydrogenase [Mycobacterium sp. AT1]
MSRLRGRTAVVTGAASGIGRGIVERLAADGAKVFVATQYEEDLASLTGGSADPSGAIVGGFCGGLDESGVAEEMITAAVAALGHVDVLVNNAGGGVILPTLEHTEETLRATIDNNLWTTIRCIRAVLPHMISRNHGRLVNIGAESVRNGLADHAMYNAAKGGVHAMVTGLAREFAGLGITANTVAPSYVLTPELAAKFESGSASEQLIGVVDQAVDLIPLGRPGSPADVAEAVAYLAGAHTGFTTGQTLYVNGGSSMG